MCFNQRGDIFPLNGRPLKLVDKFTNLTSDVSSTETAINTWFAKAWMAIERLPVIWKLDLTDKIKCSFFPAAVVSILLHGCTTWALTKRTEKSLTAITLNTARNTEQALVETHHKAAAIRPPTTHHKSMEVKRTRHSGLGWRSGDELIRDIFSWTPLHGRAKAGRPARTYIQQLCADTVIALKTSGSNGRSRRVATEDQGDPC